MIMLVDSSHNFQFPCMWNKDISEKYLRQGHASSKRKLSKAMNFPLRQFYTVLWTQSKLIKHISTDVGMSFYKSLETSENK